MRIAYLCKRRYMSKDVIVDRYARLYEIPRQLALLGHDVLGFCLGYRGEPEGRHDEGDVAEGRLRWSARSASLGKPGALVAYPMRVLAQLRDFGPDLLIGASDIPHVVLTGWLARRLRLPYVVDLYDNFEGFGQARIPGLVPALRRATRNAQLVMTTSEPLRQLVVDTYGARGAVVAIPSSVDKSVFRAMGREASRANLGLPLDGLLVGTAGGLYRDKGVEALYQAWEQLATRRPDVHLVLAGPEDPRLPSPKHERVHHLGHLEHSRVAKLFSALDVGVISVLDTTFGRYCFPQKAYEMLACELPVVAANVGAMKTLFSNDPDLLFEASDGSALATAIERQLVARHRPLIEIDDWSQLVGRIEPELRRLRAVQS